MIYNFTRKKLKQENASDYKEGDCIITGKYIIFIFYGNYNTPSLRSFVENKNTGKTLDCTPGIERPYYIDDFLHR